MVIYRLQKCAKSDNINSELTCKNKSTKSIKLQKYKNVQKRITITIRKKLLADFKITSNIYIPDFIYWLCFTLFYLTGLTIDCVEGRVYWSDIMSKAIKSSAYNGADKEDFITEGLLLVFTY